MSKRIFINNLDTYVSQAIFSELRNDQPDEEGNKPEDANVILGTYINKDSSIKPDGVKKMLKRSKPRLAGQYISGCDLIVYDLHSGNPLDVKMALEALAAPKGEDDPDAGAEKVLILISSLLAWDATPKKLIEVRDPLEIAAEEAAIKAANEARIEAVMKQIQADRKANEEVLSQADEQSDEAEEKQEVNHDEADMKEAIRIVSEENAAKGEEGQKRRSRKMLHQAFTEADYQMRMSSEEYAAIREAEDLVLNFKKENVKTYVIAAGVLYGKGEAILNSHFKKAWLQDPLRLPVVGQGNNLVPTVHVTDLARMVKKMYESKPERQYVFGIDTTKKPTQKKLIAAISNGIGTGLIEQTDIPANFAKVHPNKTPLQLDLDWRKFLLLNIKVQPSSLFTGDEPAEGEEPGESDFAWHCRAGLAGNIQLVKDEFCKHRGLKPFKIALTGKPCTGKSHFSEQLAKHYNVPHIHTAQVLKDIQHWQDEKEANYKIQCAIREKLEGESLRKQKTEHKQKADAEAAAAKEKAERKAARKAEQGDDYQSSAEEEAPKDEAPAEETAPAEGGEGEEAGDAGEPVTMAQKVATYKQNLKQFELDNAFSDDEIVELDIKKKVNDYHKVQNEGKENLKISQDLLSEAFRWRLSQNDCQNRGYVLDGYPISYETALQVFFVKGQAPEKKPPVLNEEGEEVPPEEEPMDEEALAELLKPKFQKHVYPDSLILIRGDDDYIRKQAKQLTREQNTKWDVENLARRLENWNKVNHINLFKEANNDPDLGLPSAKQHSLPITRFFQENKTEVFEIDCARNQFEMLEAMRVYIERNGRSYNYLNSVKSLNHKREEILTEEEKDADAKQAQEQQEAKIVDQKQRQALEQLADGRLEFLQQHMDALKMCDKMYMRQFLMKVIIPVLTEGMIDVWRVGPTDPVDYLADYIFKKSNDCQRGMM